MPWMSARVQTVRDVDPVVAGLTGTVAVLLVAITVLTLVSNARLGRTNQDLDAKKTALGIALGDEEFPSPRALKVRHEIRRPDRNVSLSVLLRLIHILSMRRANSF